MRTLARKRTLALGLLLCAGLCAALYARLFARPLLTVEPLPVGKSVAYLVRAPSGAYVLVDTGSDASILRALGERLPFWRRSLAVIVVTSPAVSAEGGLVAVLGRYHARFLVRPTARGAPSREAALSEALHAPKAPRVITGERGQRLVLGGGAYLDVLWPSTAAARGTSGSANLALVLRYGSTTLALPSALPAHTAQWLAHITQNTLAGVLSLSSTSPALASDGVRVWPLK